ncbi:AAA family ATPase [Taylorella asinigenitalis]|uniref:AAA family ATPase n=1 Tax=Taylorella asinigenitalis TaxID=84590 RepID=UPI00048F92D2|nr:AAA family ATPase [Taylorella asinigenitalis]
MGNNLLNKLLSETFAEAMVLKSPEVNTLHMLLALVRKDIIKLFVDAIGFGSDRLVDKIHERLKQDGEYQRQKDEEISPSKELEVIIAIFNSPRLEKLIRDDTDEEIYLHYFEVLIKSKEVSDFLEPLNMYEDLLKGIPMQDDSKEEDTSRPSEESSKSKSKSKSNKISKKDRLYLDDISYYKDKDKEEFELIPKFAVNLNELAEKGLIADAYGRDTEIEKLIHCLGRLKKGNPLLVGEAGVGKTAIVEGLGYRIFKGEVPDFLKESTVFNVDIGGMLAGSKLRGEFEMRLKGLIEEIKQVPNSIIFIDEIHTIVGAGNSVNNENLDAANMMKPALSAGEIRCIGSTTHEEYENSIAKDPALKRRFQTINIDEPDPEITLEILRRSQNKYSDFFKLRYTEEALKACVTLAERYITDKHFPDKAFDLMDLAGSYVRINKPEASLVEISDIEKMVSILVKVPEVQLSTSDKHKLKTLYKDLTCVIFGQNQAISKVVDAIKLNRSGLGKSNGPIGSFLFVGPTGVGKTELVKQLSELLTVHLIRFDMSEYNTEMGITKLLGTTAGYVGYKDQGLLSKEILKNPYSILLLDEIEKSHPSIFNLLLQIMDNGIATDSIGRRLNFKHCIIVMTSNLGADKLTSQMGFTNSPNSRDVIPEVKKFFTPEFVNRLDAIVPFEHLSEEIILRVVDKFFLELSHQLKEKNVFIIFSDKVRKYVAKEGYDKFMGARPMYRFIEEHIRKPIADELLFGALSEGGSVSVDLDEFDKLKFVFSSDSHKDEDLIF